MVSLLHSFNRLSESVRYVQIFLQNPNPKTSDEKVKNGKGKNAQERNQKSEDSADQANSTKKQNQGDKQKAERVIDKKLKKHPPPKPKKKLDIPGKPTLKSTSQNQKNKQKSYQDKNKNQNINGTNSTYVKPKKINTQAKKVVSKDASLKGAKEDPANSPSPERKQNALNPVDEIESKFAQKLIWIGCFLLAIAV
jgi:hypothetical protein